MLTFCRSVKGLCIQELLSTEINKKGENKNNILVHMVLIESVLCYVLSFGKRMKRTWPNL